MSKRTRAHEAAIGKEFECVREQRCRSVRPSSIERRHNRWPLTKDVSVHLYALILIRGDVIRCHVEGWRKSYLKV